MKLDQAYSILGLNPEASPEEVKKKYRELTKKYHPDVNKEPGADDRFKSINEAYSRVQSGEPDHDDQGINFTGFGNPFGGFNINIEDLFMGANPFIRNNRPKNNLKQVFAEVNLSLKDSIYGCKKEIVLNRHLKCQSCSGEGFIPDEKTCKTCGGKGQLTQRRGNTLFTGPCHSCKGRNTLTKKCNDCFHTGTKESQSTINITIPVGIKDGNVLRLNKMGNFIAHSPMGDSYDDAFIKINIEEDNYFTIIEDDLYSEINISLLQALKGDTVSVKTLDGDEKLIIPAKIKNKEILSIPNKGFGRVKDQKVVVHVDYPNDIDNLIKILEQ